eukprot:TRINITY_DN329_c0_g1_i1.p2 TRINITY_DN329_c0_g1~~TRINITY_DN329_c0_g1_i1.p2  ORF type:complete len:113 (-),score=15.39 TRINITY_DN329_c0_g1_i1:142-480(-)
MYMIPDATISPDTIRRLKSQGLSEYPSKHITCSTNMKKQHITKTAAMEATTAAFTTIIINERRTMRPIIVFDRNQAADFPKFLSKYRSTTPAASAGFVLASLPFFLNKNVLL